MAGTAPAAAAAAAGCSRAAGPAGSSRSLLAVRTAAASRHVPLTSEDTGRTGSRLRPHADIIRA